MNSPADIIYTLLQDQGLIATDWTGYVGFMPEEPDQLICVYDVPGNPDGRIMRTGERIEHPGVQIQVRALSYMEAYEKAVAIALALDAVRLVSVAPESGTSYTVANISRVGTIISLGMETEQDRRRHLFAMNMTMTYSVN